MTTESSLPVLIVGAGPSGLVLALSLVKNGVPIRIIDKRTSHGVGFRGGGMQPRSQELHGLLGTLPDIQNRGVPMSPIRVYDRSVGEGRKVLKEFPFIANLSPTSSRPIVNPLKINQSHQETILRSHIAKFGYEVELGTALASFEQTVPANAACVAGIEAHLIKADGSEEVAQFSWLVGADGARGVTRKALGLSFEGTRSDVIMLIGDVYVLDSDGLEESFTNTWGDVSTKSASLIHAGESNLFSFVVVDKSIKDEVPTTREWFLAKFLEITGRTDVKFGEIIFISSYRPSTRMVNTFRKGRAFVTGDAAHVHSFTGGQGMNSSIQDSFNLGWKLAMCYHGQSPDSLLDSYCAERLPVISVMIATASGLLKTILKGDVKMVDGSFHRGGHLLMLGINYRGSPITVEERTDPEVAKEVSVYDSSVDGLIVAGDRAPNAPGLEVVSPSTEDDAGITMRLFEIFSYTSHTVLIFTPKSENADADVEAVLDAVESFGEKLKIKPVIITSSGTSFNSTSLANRANQPSLGLRDGEGYAFRNYNVAEGPMTVVIVRPDGVIGAVVLSGAKGLKTYFRGILL